MRALREGQKGNDSTGLPVPAASRRGRRPGIRKSLRRSPQGGRFLAKWNRLPSAPRRAELSPYREEGCRRFGRLLRPARPRFRPARQAFRRARQGGSGAVACGWFGIQTWIGGQAIHTMLATAVPGWQRVPGGVWIAFAAFWLMNIWIVVRGSNAIKRLEAWAAPFLIAAGLALLAWAMVRAGGLGPILAQPSKFRTTGELLRVFIPSLTAMVGFWATLALNIPDLSRYARNQQAQVRGQLLGLPTTMTLFSFIGVAVTSASVLVFGEAIWDPVALLSRLGNPLVLLISLFALVIATLTTNVAANVVAPANGFANLWPSRITFAIGGVITGVLGIIIMPWRLLSDYGTYIFGWLIGYSGFLGPIAGIFIADYWLVRKARLSLADLYASDGIYGRWNPKALVALVAGVAAALIGLAVPALRVLYDYAWFVGFAVAFAVYWALMRGTPVFDLEGVPEAGGKG